MAYSGWKTYLRQYVVVPEDAEVFQVVKHGTLEMLVELFNDGAASPFSVDTAGWTLLHVSCITELLPSFLDCLAFHVANQGPPFYPARYGIST